MNNNLLKILLSAIFLFFWSNVQAEWITKKKSDETRYQDLTNNSDLVYLNCENNGLLSLDLRNGNNYHINSH